MLVVTGANGNLGRRLLKFWEGPARALVRRESAVDAVHKYAATISPTNAGVETEKAIKYEPTAVFHLFGNIAPNDAVPLETLRMGLRGDTFHSFLDK